jgi:hypothetical protein
MHNTFAGTRIFQKMEKLKRVRALTATAHTHTTIGIVVRISRLRLVLSPKSVLEAEAN